jgi:hypothetical protein
VKRSDIRNISESYLKILNEDLGLGGNAISTMAPQSYGVMGVNFPDNTNKDTPTPDNYEGQAKEMAIADLKDAVKNISGILNELRSEKKLEAWAAEKITLACDYLNTVESWIANKE